jgi:cell division transport system permease protein
MIKKEDIMLALKTAWTHIRRSPYQSAAAVSTMSLTFFVAAMFFLAAVGFQSVLTEFEKQPQITAFFADSKSEEEIRLLDEKLKTTGKVDKTVYVSKQDAYKIYQEQNKNDPLLLEMVTADILPASLEISAKDPSDLQQLATIVNEEQGIEDVIYQKEVIDTLISWTRGIRLVGVGLVSILLLVSLLVLLTVISMKIALKRKEIEILILLGATGWYIRWPFILEGGIYGLIASFLAWGASYASLLWVGPYLQSFIAGISAFSFSPLFMITLLGGMILLGFLLGALGSLMAIGRYLK